MKPRNMFPLDDICLICTLFVLLCTTTFAAPGGWGSFSGSNAVAFSSANSNAQAGSTANAVSSAHAVSSANAFAGGSVPSNNRDGVNHELTHHPSISTGSGSYVGYGNNKPNSDKFGLTHHQVSGSTGNYNDDKSHAPCSSHQNKEDEWKKGEHGDYDEQSEEKDEESEQEEDSENPYDDGQYRPEHHYYEHANKKQHHQTASGVHKLGDNHPYNHDGSVSGYGSEINNNAGSTNSQTKDSPHLISSWSDVNKQTGPGHANAGIPGSVAPPNLNSNSHNKDGSTNAGTFSVTGDKTNLHSTSGTNVGCSSTTPGSDCGTSSTGSGQGPIKLEPSDIVQTPNLPAVKPEIGRETIGCGNNFNGNCGNAKPTGIGQYPSVSDAGHKPSSLDQQSTGQWPGVGNKPSSLDQQSAGQWPGVANKPSSLDQQSAGQWPGAGSKPSLNQPNTGQWPGVANKPSLDQQSAGQWPGAGSKPSLNQPNTGQWPGVGNKPSSLDQQSAGQWPGAANKPSSLDQQSAGQWPGVGNKPSSLDQQSIGQWPGTANKPTLDQQSTGQWSDIPASVVAPNLNSHNKDESTNAGTFSITGDKKNLDSTSGINIGCSSTRPGSNCGTSSTGSGQGPVKLEPSDIVQTPNLPAVKPEISRETIGCGNNFNGNCGNAKPNGIGQYPSVPVAGNKPSFNQPNTGQWPGVGNKPSSLDQQSAGQWPGVANKPSLDQQSAGQWPGVANKPSLDQQSAGQWPGVANKPSSLDQQSAGQWPGVGNKPSSLDQQSTGQWTGAGNQPHIGIGIKQPIGSGNCGTVGGNQCTSSAGYPGSTGTTGVSSGQNVEGQMHAGNAGDGHEDKNIYKVNAENPFLYGQGNIPSLIYTTSSPVQVPSHTIGIVETTSKPIGLGNPFLDGTLEISNTHGMQNINTDKSDHNIVVTTTESSNKPIGAGNPFLMHGHKHSKGDSPIYNIAIPIGGTQAISTLPPVTTTIKPIGIANPFFQPSGGKAMDNLPEDGQSGGIKGDKNTVSGSGTAYPANPAQYNPTDKDSTHYPKVGNAEIGVPASEIHKNINSGVKGGAYGNKELGSIANSNAGVLATGNVNKPNIPGTYNGYDNVGLNGGSLTENANKPINSLSHVPGSYDQKVTPQIGGNAGSNSDKATLEPNALINGNNGNNPYNPEIANGAALSLATANAGATAGSNAGSHAGSYSSAFSSSQASSSSFASSQSASYAASGDLSGIAPQGKGTWPFDIPGNVNVNNTWSNAASQASSFAANSSGRWSGSHPVGVKGR